MRHFKKTGGFTLVELIITIAILATLSSVAVVGYTSYVKKANDAAAQTFLEDMKKRVMMANVQVGNVDTIEVYPMDGNLLFIKVKAACFSGDFTHNIKAVFPDAIDIAPNNSDYITAYSFSIPAPPGWEQSDYADVRKLVYDRLKNVWEIYPQ